MRLRARIFAPLFPFLLFIIALAFPGCSRQPAVRKPLAPSDITIVNNEDGRQLIIGGRVREFVDTLTWQSQLRYSPVMELPMHFFQSPGSALLIGIGGGSVANSYARQRWSVDVVEPDSLLIDVVTRSFGLNNPAVTIRRQEAEVFISSSSKTYDVILIDALSAGTDPGSLLTKELFRLATSRLRQHGILAIAMESVGWHDRIVKDLAFTLQQSVPQIGVFPIAEPPDKFGSIIVYGSDLRRDDLVWDIERNVTYHPGWRFSGEYQKAHGWDNHFVPDVAGATVQTAGSNSWHSNLSRLADSLRSQPKDYLP